MLSPLLFIAVLDLISRKTVLKGCHEETPICRRLGAGGKQELQEAQWSSGTGCLAVTG